MKPPHILRLLVVFLLIAAACGDDDDTVSTTQAPTATTAAPSGGESMDAVMAELRSNLPREIRLRLRYWAQRLQQVVPGNRLGKMSSMTLFGLAAARVSV